MRSRGGGDLLNGEGRVMVLTPHPGEMARLAGMTVKEVEADRIGLARRFATEHKVTLVLKGWRTLVAHPDGRIAVNTSGNPAMAKGGSGDILTGIVAAMLAQYAARDARMWRGRWRRRFICMGWRRILRRRRWMSIRCLQPIRLRICRMRFGTG